jgi:hypothetical protein
MIDLNKSWAILAISVDQQSLAENQNTGYTELMKRRGSTHCPLSKRASRQEDLTH